MPPQVSIIILNWNGWKDTIECLESIYQINYENYNVIVVDNCSEDDSVIKIKEYCQGNLKVESNFFKYDTNNKPIKVLEYRNKHLNSFEKMQKIHSEKLILIKNKKNYGFSEGNNVGIKFAVKILKSDYVLLLNNDTVVDKNFLVEMINVAETDIKIGIISPKIYFYEKKQLIQTEGIRINWFLGEFKQINYKKNDNDNQLDKNRIVDAVCGCSMLIKKDTISEVGLLDKSYFLYFEDYDFCIRAQRLGFKIMIVPDSKIWHKISISAKKTTGTREYYSGKNHIKFMKIYSNKKEYLSFLVYFFLYKFWFTNAVIIIYHNNFNGFVCYLKGIIKGISIK